MVTKPLDGLYIHICIYFLFYFSPRHSFGGPKDLPRWWHQLSPFCSLSPPGRLVRPVPARRRHRRILCLHLSPPSGPRQRASPAGMFDTMLLQSWPKIFVHTWKLYLSDGQVGFCWDYAASCGDAGGRGAGRRAGQQGRLPHGQGIHRWVIGNSST